MWVSVCVYMYVWGSNFQLHVSGQEYKVRWRVCATARANVWSLRPVNFASDSRILSTRWKDTLTFSFSFSIVFTLFPFISLHLIFIHCLIFSPCVSFSLVTCLSLSFSLSFSAYPISFTWFNNFHSPFHFLTFCFVFCSVLVFLTHPSFLNVLSSFFYLSIQK